MPLRKGTHIHYLKWCKHYDVHLKNMYSILMSQVPKNFEVEQLEQLSKQAIVNSKQGTDGKLNCTFDQFRGYVYAKSSTWLL